eukprot:3856157-Heterocapsa_arctica.AAC.1
MRCPKRGFSRVGRRIAGRVADPDTEPGRQPRLAGHLPGVNEIQKAPKRVSKGETMAEKRGRGGGRRPRRGIPRWGKCIAIGR